MISCPLRRLSMSWFLLSLILCSTTSVCSQSISTSTPIPPLQWINLTGLLSGTNAAPPLKDASIGYDSTLRNLLIFGGESAQGFPQSQTYLLNLDTLIWASPSPPSGLSSRPPARSAAISGDDYAASYRHAHVVIGGKGTDDQPLSDVWAFDYTSQFWEQVTVSGSNPPSARWGSAGGIDIRTSPIQDPVLTGPNNTFYQAGGFDGKNALPLSDIWRLNISGTLSANNLQSVSASWEKVSIQGTLPSKIDFGGVVVLQGSQQHVVAAGGCSTSSATNNTCADGGSYVINIDAKTENSPNSCPAPRFGPALAPNANAQSSNFNSQVFMLLGTFNSSLWDDNGGLEKGEVAVLDINTGTWSRVLPAGDPGSVTGGPPTFPSPREGAVAFSFQQGLVGDSETRGLVSDTIVFGGKDALGNYLNEIWVLRAYNGTITQSNQHWTGFGDGQLRGGVDADGEGVTVEYMTQCASAKDQPSGSGSSPSSTSSNTPGPSSTDQPSTNLYDASVVHKILAPVSVALVLPAVFIYRLSTPSVVSPRLLERRMALFYLSVVVVVAAFGVGIGGLANAFTSISYTGSLIKRSGSLNLVTAHGRAGLALFAGLYVLVPVILIISACAKPRGQAPSEPSPIGRPRANSTETAEKLGLYTNRVGSPQPTTNGTLEDQAPSLPPESRQPTRSWNSLSPWPLSRGNGRRSSESGLDAQSSPSTVRSFEVTNRPARARRASANSLAALSDPRVTQQQRNLNDMGWMDRRRSITTVGELDYALTQLQSRGRHPSTPGTAMMDMTSTRGLMVPTADLHAPRMPGRFDIFLHIILHAFLLALCIFSLIALWSRGTMAGFAVFLVWTAIFYVGLFMLAWNGVPRESILTVVFGRLRAEPHAMPVPTSSSPGPSRPLSDIGMDSIPFPSDSRGPYQHHQPPFRTAHEHDYPLPSHGHDTREVYDDDEDEESRQRRIEEEMSRRDVSIVTVPKRKLFLTNPEVS